MKKSPALAIVLLAPALIALSLGGTPAGADRINTGAADGPYQKHFCGVLAQQLKLAQFDFACAPSAGTRETVERVLADPHQLGYAQLDAFAFLTKELKAEAAFTIVRHDDVRQCLYAVTRNPQLTNWGEVSANAQRLRVVLPAADFGQRQQLSTPARDRSRGDRQGARGAPCGIDRECDLGRD